jgi:dTDP-4-amino-4,6-dideoxygalactose transaminase
MKNHRGRRYIGGEIEIDGWPARDAPARFVSPPGSLSVTTGRTGIFLAARAAKRRHSGPAIVPSYICDSVVVALRRAGMEVHYYPIGTSLTVQGDLLVDVIERYSPALVVIVHYFGFPAAPDLFNRLGALRRRFFVLEDCAHGSWIESSRPVVGLHGDFVLTSFRKYLGVPDGGLLLNRSSEPIVAPPEVNADFVRWRLAAKLLRGARLTGGVGPVADGVYLDLFRAAEDALDRDVPIGAMSSVSAALVRAECPRDRMRKRRMNYRHVLAAIKSRDRVRRLVQPMFEKLPSAVSPLVFPVRVANGARNRLRQRLMDARVFCPVLWPLPPSVSRRTFPAAHQLGSEMLGLPIDQRYDAAAIDELIERLLFSCRSLA